MNKIVFAVMSCNRMHYAKNCINSIIEFVDMDRIILLVCDNHTIEPGFDSYLDGMAKAHKNVVIQQFPDRTRNELYRAMNFAITFCQKQGHDIVNFIQDDYQYLFSNDRILDEIPELFKKRRNIVQVNHNMAWKRKDHKVGELAPFTVGRTNYVELKKKGPCDSGFTRVKVYNKIGLYPNTAISWEGGYMHSVKGNRYAGKLNGESWFCRRCRKIGKSRAVTLFPNSTMLFDCAYVRGDKRYGDYFPPPHKYYIKPFDETQQAKVKARHDKREWCFIEQMTEPDGWTPATFLKHSLSKKWGPLV